ncbi:disease resistance protein RUN1-like [Rosa rugosa]|uniref:disease resistance protein RUN1-like n=1 Tax=Rosa rugosa TaxID=74645 RepID=UPI002B40F69C|nr:disease resistance protein RUN1-like [Rosa rugosa]
MASPINEAAAGSSSSSLSRSSADHQNHYKYEVFLSFRGEDTRYGFTDHLYTALRDRGIETFRDADELRRGEEISPALLKAIEESRVSIVVFSPKYASSRWCLDELVKILECRNSKGQVVKPVFYKVDPSHVRHQIDAFGTAFATLRGRYGDIMDKWKAALKDAADLFGWHLKDDEYVSNPFTSYLIIYIFEVRDYIYQENCWGVVRPTKFITDLHVAEHPIGLESCRRDVNNLLGAEGNIVRMVAIWGPGGIGKTTIAKDVFNSISHKFDYSCYLADVRSITSTTSDGLARLQERLLFDILSDSALKVSSVDQGVSFIKTRMRHKTVLLLLDDVSDYSQLQKLVPSPDCFGLGSRILITTRDKGWLSTRVDGVYEVKMLDDVRSLKLFSLHAFEVNEPPDDYLELARRAVHYAKGLPLALILLGSHLFRTSREEWEATLDSCKGEDPYRKIRNILKISYDALGVDLRGYFLDIACFFKGQFVDNVKPILEACYDVKSGIGIKKLQEKALIRIDDESFKGGFIWMHDLIEEMGKGIVNQESPEEPGERSRMWSEVDVNDVLTYNTGTKEVKGIQVPWRTSTISLNAKSFSGMEKLRYISISPNLNYDFFSGDIDYLSKELRWLDWPKCPLQCFPSNFHAKKLVNLNVSGSCRITRLWEGRKNFSTLTCMNLSGCESLKELPHFSGMPNLKKLNLSGCTSLVEVPDSIRFLHNLKSLDASRCSKLATFPKILVKMDSLRLLSLKGSDIRELDESIKNLNGLEELDLSGCKNLTTLPCNIYGLQNLKTLDASGCSKLATFPKIPVKMDSLRRLSLSGSDIKELDESIENLTGLEYLDLTDCKNLTTLPCSIYGLQNLNTLDASGCSKLATFPKIPVKMDSLRRLYLKGSDIRELDESIENLNGLEELDLSGCKNLTTLPCSIYGLQNLKTLDASGCSKLATFPKIPVKMDSLRRLFLKGSGIRELDESIENLNGLEELDLRGCKNLTTLPCSIYGLQNLKTLDARGCSKLATFPKIPVKMDSLRRLFLKGSDIRELDESIENLNGLEELDLRGCKNLTTLPCSIYGLQNLKTLDASGCSKLATFPKIPVKMDSLRRLFLKGSDIRELDESIENLNGLEELDLRGCKNLTTLPCSIYGLQNLKTLDARGCSKLATFPKIPVKMDSLRRLYLKGSDIRELDESIENLNGLEELGLRGCKNLTTLPCSIYGLQNLKTLYAGGCSKLATFPKIPVEMDSLRRLSLKGSDIRELDESIENLNGLEELGLRGCKNLTTLPCSIYGLQNLKTLYAGGCSKLATFPKIPVEMDSLRLLSLKGSDIRELDESIGNLIGLEYLDLTDCENLTTLPCSIYGLQNLWFLDLGECSKLVRFPTNTKILNVDGCSVSLPKLGVFSIAGCSSLSDCDFLMTLDCWETLQWLNLSRNNFVSLPACLTKFVKLRDLDFSGCKRLRGIPELPPKVKLQTWGCESLEERSSTLIEAISPILMIPDLPTHHGGWRGWRSYLQQERERVPIAQLVHNFNTIRNQPSC